MWNSSDEYKKVSPSFFYFRDHHFNSYHSSNDGRGHCSSHCTFCICHVDNFGLSKGDKVLTSSNLVHQAGVVKTPPEGGVFVSLETGLLLQLVRLLLIITSVRQGRPAYRWIIAPTIRRFYFYMLLCCNVVGLNSITFEVRCKVASDSWII